MSIAVTELYSEASASDWVEVARSLGRKFAERAAMHDRRNEFVAANYRDLHDHRLFSVAIPAELGGGGATYEEVSTLLRELGRHCGSTALAFAMHTHPIAVNVFKHLRGDEAATRTLRRLAENELVIAGTGANDWLESSGEAERCEGGYRVSAHKRFVSGAPGAQVLVSSVSHSGSEGVEVIHFAIPFNAEGVRIVETWEALGMRGTGSHDVVLEDVFVPDASIVARRPAGMWHPVWNVILPTAMPLITSVYVGLAEEAADMATAAATRRQSELAPVVGEMLNALTVARLALDDMIRLNANHGFTPSLELADAILTRKSIASESVRKTVETAAELVGGPGFIQGHPMERIVRDVRALHYHPLPVRRQQIFSGRIALGYDPVSGQ